MNTPAVSFVARSGTGKTTLVTRVIAELKRRGYRVGALKHRITSYNVCYTKLLRNFLVAGFFRLQGFIDERDDFLSLGICSA